MIGSGPLRNGARRYAPLLPDLEAAVTRSRSLAGAAALLVALAGGCGDDAPAPTSAPPASVAGEPTPAAAAAAWFAAVGEGRAADASALLVDDQLALLLAIENGLDAVELHGLLQSEVPEEAQQQYWDTFATGFAEFAGDAIENLEPGAVDEFVVDGRRFASVRVGLAPGAGSTGFMTADVGGRWRVDLLATLAPALGSQLRSLVTGLPPGPEGEAVGEVLVGQIPSLRAATEQPVTDADDAVLRELEALVRFLAPATEE